MLYLVVFSDKRLVILELEVVHLAAEARATIEEDTLQGYCPWLEGEIMIQFKEELV